MLAYPLQVCYTIKNKKIFSKSQLWDLPYDILKTRKTERVNAMLWDIVATRGYYEVYVNGEFAFSADSRREAMEEMEAWESEHIA